MRIKRFRGKDLRETLDQVKAALGPDAVIISTRKVKRGTGAYGLFEESIMEVEAASLLEDDMVPEIYDDEEMGDFRPKAGSGRRPVESETGYETDTGLDAIGEDLIYDLCGAGLTRDSAREILTRAGSSLPVSDLGSPEGQRKHVRKILSLLFEVRDSISVRQPGDDGPAITNFIGPTGVGKTTTIAKIASACTKRRLKVGLITLDTHRVGALAQMRQLAGMLRLPLLPVSSKDEMHRALHKFQKADVVLVDTAGRSYSNQPRMEEIVELFGGEERQGENHLVLAANTHLGDLKRMVKEFSRIPLHGLTFTKLDETSQFGVIFELHMDLGAPVTYLTSGQRIPEDLESVSPEKIARLILPAARELASTNEAAF
jgi:flagellar biosynthesis protein FlhF